MTSWGAYESNNSVSRLRVGIDITRFPSTLTHSTTSIDLQVKYYVQSDAGDYDDTQTLSMYGEGGYNSSTTFHNGGGLEGPIATKAINNIPINFSGTGTRKISGAISGAYDGVTPRHDVYYNLPARPADVPGKPATPTVSSVGTTSASASWSAPDNNGSSIIAYEALWETTSGANVRSVSSSDRADAVTGLSPNTPYTFRVRARNSVGWGPYSNERPFTTDVALPGNTFSPSYTNITATGVRVNYSFPSDGGGTIDEVEINFEIPPSTTDILRVSDTNGSPRDVTGLTRKTTYAVQLRAHNQAGWGD